MRHFSSLSHSRILKFIFVSTFIISFNLVFVIIIRFSTSLSLLPSIVTKSFPSKLMLRIKSWDLFFRAITAVLPCPRLMWSPFTAQARWSISTSSWCFSSESAISTVSFAFHMLFMFTSKAFTFSKSSNCSIAFWLYRENRSWDSMQPCLTPFFIWIHAVFLSHTCTDIFCFQYRFLINRIFLPSTPVSCSIPIIVSCFTVSKAL